MKEQSRGRFSVGLAVLFVVLAVTLLINFAHTERTLHSSSDCPACHFQNSSLATQVTPCLFLPRIAFIEVVEAAVSSEYRYLAAIDLSSRGPPQA